MEITISADSFAELKSKILYLSKEINGETPVQFEFPIETPQVKTSVKTKSKKPVQIAVEDSQESEVTDPIEEIAAAKPVTKEEKTISKDDVGKALQTVFDKHGLAEAQKILKPFGAKALREVKPEHFEAVIAACKKSIKD